MVGVTERPPPLAGARARLAARWADLACAGFLLVIAVFLLHQGRGTTFYFDEWSIWQGRYGASPDLWLTDVNGHLCPVPVLIFTTLAKVFGAESLTPFRVAVVLTHLALLALLYVTVRRRYGGPLALAIVLPLGVVAQSWLDLLMPFTGIFVIGPLVFGLAAHLCLTREDRLGDVAACVLLTLSIATGGGGVAVVAGFGAYLLFLKPQWRRLWVAAVPLVLYVVWRKAYNVPAEFQLNDIGLIWGYTYRGLVSGFGAYTNLGPDAGRVAALLAIAYVAFVLWRGADVSRALAAAVIGGVAYWSLIAIARGPELGPEEVRYVYANEVFALTIVLAALPRAVPRVGWPQFLIAGTLGLFILLSQVYGYKGSAQAYRDGSDLVRADLFVFVTEEKLIAPDFSSQPILNAGQYLDARKYRSAPTPYTEAQIRASNPKVRDYTDTVLAKALKLAVAPQRPPAFAPLSRPAPQGAGSVRADGTSCWRVNASAAPATVEVAEGGVAVQAGDTDVKVTTGRYGDVPKDDVGTVAAKTDGTLAIPADTARVPWRVALTSPDEFRVCGIPRS